METIRFLQSFSSPWLDRLFLAATWLGSEDFFLAVLPLLFWCTPPAFAFRLVLLVPLGAWGVQGLKELFQVPRPDASLRLLVEEAELGFAFPSGHAQVSVLFWGYVAGWVRRPWVTALACTAALLCGLSRVYLGVHWPLDVVGGAALGVLLLALLHAVDGPCVRLVGRVGLAPAAVAAALVSGVLALASPTGLAVRLAGAAGGSAVGYALLRRLAPTYQAGGGAARWALRVLLGLGVLLALRKGGAVLLPDVEPAHFARYFLMGAWVTLGPPLLVTDRPAPAPGAAPAGAP